MKLTAIILGSIYAFYILWIAYLAIMNLKKARDENTLTKFTYYFSFPLLFMGYLLDIIINFLVGTVVFVDLPREFTLSSRLSRYVDDQPKSWRADVAKVLAKNLLDPFDPDGKHI